jgi:hypothetical protein
VSKTLTTGPAKPTQVASKNASANGTAPPPSHKRKLRQPDHEDSYESDFVEDDMEDSTQPVISAIISRIFPTRKYSFSRRAEVEDDDDAAMEAGFDEIEEEERRRYSCPTYLLSLSLSLWLSL